uniref:Uncharacterized protein n=1 Tax=Cacopsylla melanoneura TaxID=428564 RepID=A0A8D8XPX9_9HEMI
MDKGKFETNYFVIKSFTFTYTFSSKANTIFRIKGAEFSSKIISSSHISFCFSSTPRYQQNKFFNYNGCLQGHLCSCPGLPDQLGVLQHHHHYHAIASCQRSPNLSWPSWQPHYYNYHNYHNYHSCHY